MTLKAKFEAHRSDLHWSLYDIKDGFVRWTGYDDTNWWETVSTREQARTKIGKETGRKYTINFTTNEVTIDT
jgi:hypothetical protein